MTESVNKAVAVRDNSPGAMVQQYRDDFAMVLPSHIKPETWVRLALGLVRRDQKLAAAAQSDPAALIVALMDAARQGLEPGTEQYYLTPRKVKGKMTVLGIRGYQGEIELMYRAGAISSVIVEVVREKDTFRYSPGRMDRPEHEIDWDAADRGKLRLAYAYAIMKDGATSKVVVLNKTHIAAARAMSQGADSEYSPWQRHEESMWLKTAAHRLQKWVPTSSEYIREQLRAAKEVAAEPLMQTVPPVKNLGSEWTEAPAEQVYDGELVDDDDRYLPDDPDLNLPAGGER